MRSNKSRRERADEIRQVLLHLSEPKNLLIPAFSVFSLVGLGVFGNQMAEAGHINGLEVTAAALVINVAVWMTLFWLFGGVAWNLYKHFRPGVNT